MTSKKSGPLEKLKQALRETDTYFISWLGDQQIIQEELVKILDKLFKHVNRVPLALQKEEEGTIILKHGKKIVDKKKLDKAKDESLHLSSIIHDLSTYLVEAFLYIMGNDISGAKEALAKVKTYMEFITWLKRDETLDYFIGFQYLVELLEIHMKIVDADGPAGLQNSTAIKDFCRGLKLPAAPNKLNTKAMAGVWAAKWTLNELYSDRWEEAVANLKEIARLDPGNWLWHYILCCRARAIRRTPGRSEGKRRTFPSQDEIQSATKCLQIVPEYYRAMAVAGSIQVLAEMVRYRYDNKQNDSFQYGDNHFTCNDEAVEYILSTIGSAIDKEEEEEVTFAENIRYGEILSSILPCDYQDNEMAQRCLTKALEELPENSKALHRMGIFQQTNKKDTVTAMLYLEHAVASDPRNIPAYMTLIQLLLKPTTTTIEKDNITKLDSVFEGIFNRPPGGFDTFSKSQLWKFEFLQGFHFYKKGAINDAIQVWTTCFSTQKPEDQLEREFKGLGRRYLIKIHKSLKDTTHVDTDESSKNGFDGIVKILETLLANSHYFERRQGLWRENNNNIEGPETSRSYTDQGNKGRNVGSRPASEAVGVVKFWRTKCFPPTRSYTTAEILACYGIQT